MSTTEPIHDPVAQSGANDHHHLTTTNASARTAHDRRSGVFSGPAQVLVVLDISVVNTALPTIGADLQLSSGDLQWVVTAYLSLSGGGLLLGGRIADLLSRRRVLVTGLAVFTTASLVSGHTWRIKTLVSGRR